MNSRRRVWENKDCFLPNTQVCKIDQVINIRTPRPRRFTATWTYQRHNLIDFPFCYICVLIFCYLLFIFMYIFNMFSIFIPITTNSYFQMKLNYLFLFWFFLYNKILLHLLVTSIWYKSILLTYEQEWMVF